MIRLLNLDESSQANFFSNMFSSKFSRFSFQFPWLPPISFVINNLVFRENLFEDGSHLYRFLDDDPVVATQCHNVARGIIEVKPKPITDISSRLRFLSFAILEAYVSEDGKHVDYRSIHGSEEFARSVSWINCKRSTFKCFAVYTRILIWRQYLTGIWELLKSSKELKCIIWHGKRKSLSLLISTIWWPSMQY